jgi:hypothetical protein
MLGSDTFNQQDERFAQEDGGIQRNFAQLSSGALFHALITDGAFLGAQLNSALTLLTY